MKVPSAKELRERIALAEGAKAAAALKAHEAAEKEKREMLEHFAHPSGLNDEQVVEKASTIVNRAVENGLMSVQVFRFPHAICTDNGRAINQAEPGWEKTLTGIPKKSRTSGNAGCSRTAITSATRSSIIPAACRATSASS